MHKVKKLSQNLLMHNWVFQQDIQDVVALSQIIHSLKYPYIMFKHLIYVQQDQHLDASFLILTTSQQYSLILSSLRNRPSYLQATFVQLKEFRTVTFKTQMKNFNVPRVCLYSQNGKVESRIMSRVNSKNGSRIYSLTSECQEVEKYFDDPAFYERNNNTPCSVQNIKLQKQLVDIYNLINQAVLIEIVK
ncbi:Hypothetical_protein [Hexamita inflata]|uniref:Hypothetical_protein n=1 Tax=Hexamita inflata TaxID=28002 RepID=A0AA86N7G6_9EUKA|nr:Hypothetical protein HINF_LOCUS2112 [Hexamita inflata]